MSLASNQGGEFGIDGRGEADNALVLSLNTPRGIWCGINGTGATATATPFVFIEFVNGTPCTSYHVKNNYPNNLRNFWIAVGN